MKQVVAQHGELRRTWALGDQDLGSGTNELNDLWPITSSLRLNCLGECSSSWVSSF